MSRALSGHFSTALLAALHCRLDVGSGRYVQDREPDVGPAVEDKQIKGIERLRAVIEQQKIQIAGYRNQVRAATIAQRIQGRTGGDSENDQGKGRGMMDNEHDLTRSAIAALDDFDASRVADTYRPGAEGYDRTPVYVGGHRVQAAIGIVEDEIYRLRTELTRARRWHATQQLVCADGRHPAMAKAHADRMDAIDAALNGPGYTAGLPDWLTN